MKRIKKADVSNSSYYPILSKSIASSRRRIKSSLNSRHLLVFMVGVFIGVTLALILHHYQSGSMTSSSDGTSQHGVNIFEYFFNQPISKVASILTYVNAKYNFSYKNWLKRIFGAHSISLDPDTHRYQVENGTASLNDDRDETSGFQLGTEAHFLYQKIPVICLVFSPSSAKSISAVVNTWGQHCNYIHFYYSTSRKDGIKTSAKRKRDKKIELIYNDTNIDNKLLKEKVTIDNIPEAKSEFALFCRAFHRIHNSIPNQNKEAFLAPWILVAPEDSYILTENLRYYVAPMNQTKALYLGHAMEYWSSIYNWMDASFALNWVTLERLVSHFSTNKSCDEAGKYWKNGDRYLGKHLAKLGIYPEDTRDHAGRGRFNGYSMKRLLFPGGVSSFEKYWKNSVFGAPSDGPGCCSNFAVSFAGVLSRSKMYQQEYLHHHLRPFFGGGTIGNKAPLLSKEAQNLHPSLTWDEFLKENARFNLFDPTLTTPKAMEKLLQEELGR